MATYTSQYTGVQIDAAVGNVLASDTQSNSLVSKTDIGTDPNQLPLNQYLGTMAFQNASAVVIKPQASEVPSGIGDMVFELTSNASLTIKVKGSDGTVRSAVLTLA